MKLAEALQILNQAQQKEAVPYRVALASGFTPLHLGTFLQAELQMRLADRRVQIEPGLYGDLVGNVERLAGVDAAAVVVEWADLEPRLGYRRLGGWAPSQAVEIVETFESRLGHLEAALRAASQRIPVVVAPPSLRLPPAFLPGNAKAAAEALRLRSALAACWARLACPHISILNPEELDRLSPPAGRFDLKSELLTGFPYSLPHAGALARLLAEGLPGRSVLKKALITDLDDTLWSGILGEVGPQSVSWDLDNHSQLHGLYQQMLASLVGQGTLVAAASKNDAALVDQLWRERSDLLIRREQIFPFEVHWGAKSESVARILQAWNIGAASVVFVDDSPLELAEVQAAFPEVECIQFPKNDPAAVLELLYRLRDLFGKDTLEAEDALRLESIRQGSRFQQEAALPAERQEEFLSQLDATVTMVLNPPPDQKRVLELVNKTNQFNLNGVRFDEAEWRRLEQEPGAFTVAVSYQDRFGPLGTIAVLQGAAAAGSVRVRTWVMSCRAFSRRIEHCCLGFLFDHFGVDTITFEFRPTARNGPSRSFFREFLGAEPEGELALKREASKRLLPALHHRLRLGPNEGIAHE